MHAVEHPVHGQSVERAAVALGAVTPHRGTRCQAGLGAGAGAAGEVLLWHLGVALAVVLLSHGLQRLWPRFPGLLVAVLCMEQTLSDNAGTSFDASDILVTPGAGTLSNFVAYDLYTDSGFSSALSNSRSVSSTPIRPASSPFIKA